MRVKREIRRAEANPQRAAERMQYSGVGSQATIAAAIRHFEQMRLLQIVRMRGELAFRRVNQYHLTLDES